MRGKQSNSILGLWLVTAVLCGPAHAEDVLSSLAGILAPVSQAAAGAIAAKSAENIAETNGRTSIELAQIAANNSQKQGETMAQISLFNAQTTQKMNWINQLGKTERDMNVLAAQERMNNANIALEREKLDRLWSYQQQELRLAYEQLKDQKRLAEMTLQARLAAAGLVSGFKTIDSTAALTVKPFSSPQAVAAQPAQVATAPSSLLPFDLPPIPARSFRPSVSDRLLGAATSPQASSFGPPMQASLAAGSFRNDRLTTLASVGTGPGLPESFSSWVRHGSPSRELTHSSRGAARHHRASEEESQ